MGLPWNYQLFKKFCPYGEWPVAERLWRGGLYRKWWNYLVVEFQMARGHVFQWGKPYWLTVDPTNFCQLQCPFCPTGAGRGVRDKAALKPEHFKRFMDRLGPTAIHMDMMNWGEPFLNKDLPEMISYAKRYRIEVKVDANLNDLSQETAEALVRSGLDILSVSIDGASQETYEKYRIRGNLQKVLENVRKIVHQKKTLGSPTPRLIWQFLVFKHNEHEMEQVRQMAKELEIEDVSFVAPFMPNEAPVLKAWLPENQEYRLYAPASSNGSGAGAQDPREVVHIQSVPSYKSYRARRFRRHHLYRFPYLLRNRRWEVWQRAREARRQSSGDKNGGSGNVPYQRPPERLICKWPWAGMTVNPDGSVAPCCSVEDQGDDFGNILETGFGRMWNGRMYRRSRRHVRRYVRGQELILSDSDHVCDRCTAIGYANFKFPGEWSRSQWSVGARGAVDGRGGTKGNGTD